MGQHVPQSLCSSNDTVFTLSMSCVTLLFAFMNWRVWEVGASCADVVNLICAYLQPPMTLMPQPRRKPGPMSTMVRNSSPYQAWQFARQFGAPCIRFSLDVLGYAVFGLNHVLEMEFNRREIDSIGHRMETTSDGSLPTVPRPPAEAGLGAHMGTVQLLQRRSGLTWRGTRPLLGAHADPFRALILCPGWTL